MKEQVKTSRSENFWKTGFFTLLFLLIIGANALVWYFFLKTRTSTPTSPSVSQPTAITATPTPLVDETTLIKQAILKMTGLSESKAEITISKNTGKHARGGIKEFGAVGGAYWIAAKVDETWVGVYVGQSNLTCVQIAPYNFPKEIVPECLDENGKVVKR